MKPSVEPSRLQGYFTNPDLGYSQQLKQWVEEELRECIEHVTQVEIDTDMIEQPPSESGWKHLKPGRFIHFTVTFAYGDRAHKTFRVRKEYNARGAEGKVTCLP